MSGHRFAYSANNDVRLRTSLGPTGVMTRIIKIEVTAMASCLRVLFALYAAAAVSAAPQSGSTITVSSASSAPATTVTSTIVPSSAISASVSGSASVSSAVSASAHKFTGASTFAGAATSFVYPPPGATGTSLDTFFPGPDEVGHFGATPSELSTCF